MLNYVNSTYKCIILYFNFVITTSIKAGVSFPPSFPPAIHCQSIPGSSGRLLDQVVDRLNGWSIAGSSGRSLDRVFASRSLLATYTKDDSEQLAF